MYQANQYSPSLSRFDMHLLFRSLYYYYNHMLIVPVFNVWFPLSGLHAWNTSPDSSGGPGCSMLIWLSSAAKQTLCCGAVCSFWLHVGCQFLLPLLSTPLLPSMLTLPKLSLISRVWAQHPLTVCCPNRSPGKNFGQHNSVGCLLAMNAQSKVNLFFGDRIIASLVCPCYWKLWSRLDPLGISPVAWEPLCG